MPLLDMQPLMPIQARCKLYFCYKSESDKVVRACEWSVTHQNASDVKMSCVCNKSTPLLLYLVPHCYCAWSPIVTALIPPLLLHLIHHCYCTRYLTVTALGPPLLLHLVPTVTALGPSLLLHLVPHCYCAWSLTVTALGPPLLLHLVPHCYCGLIPHYFCTWSLTVTALDSLPAIELQVQGQVH